MSNSINKVLSVDSVADQAVTLPDPDMRDCVERRSIMSLHDDVMAGPYMHEFKRAHRRGWSRSMTGQYTQHVLDGRVLWHVSFNICDEGRLAGVVAKAEFPRDTAAASSVFGRMGEELRRRASHPTAAAVETHPLTVEVTWPGQPMKTGLTYIVEEDKAVVVLEIARAEGWVEAFEASDEGGPPEPQGAACRVGGLVDYFNDVDPRHLRDPETLTGSPARFDLVPGSRRMNFGIVFPIALELPRAVFPGEALLRTNPDGLPLEATVVFDLVTHEETVEACFVGWKWLSEGLAAEYGPPQFTGAAAEPAWGMCGWEQDGLQVLIEFGPRVIGGLALRVLREGVGLSVERVSQVLAN